MFNQFEKKRSRREKKEKRKRTLQGKIESRDESVHNSLGLKTKIVRLDFKSKSNYAF